MAKRISKREAAKRKLPEWLSYERDAEGRRRLRIDGLPVRNGKKRFEVEVEQDDIRGAQVKNPRRCAVARAVQRLGGDAVVMRDRIFVKPKGAEVWDRYNVSTSMKMETTAFDRGGRVAPGVMSATPLTPWEIKNDLHGKGGRSNKPPKGAAARPRPTPAYVPDVRHFSAAPQPRKRA